MTPKDKIDFLIVYTSRMNYLCIKSSSGFFSIFDKATMEHPPENDPPKYSGLMVNKGISRPPSVNPYMKKPLRSSTLSVTEYVEGILSGDRVILSRAVTLVESSRPEHQDMAQAIIEKCLPYAGNSIRVGITGVPGAGKSTSIDAFGIHLLKNGHKLAVLAIDPSSERSKGSILGDKTRMEKLSREHDAFIRPLPRLDLWGGRSTQNKGVDYPL